MSATLKAEILTKLAIRSYEEEVGVPVAGCAILERIFHQIYLAHLIHETLGERKFHRILQSA
jgi:hypothetical protein